MVSVILHFKKMSAVQVYNSKKVLSTPGEWQCGFNNFFLLNLHRLNIYAYQCKYYD